MIYFYIIACFLNMSIFFEENICIFFCRAIINLSMFTNNSVDLLDIYTIQCTIHYYAIYNARHLTVFNIIIIKVYKLPILSLYFML